MVKRMPWMGAGLQADFDARQSWTIPSADHGNCCLFSTAKNDTKHFFAQVFSHMGDTGFEPVTPSV